MGRLIVTAAKSAAVVVRCFSAPTEAPWVEKSASRVAGRGKSARGKQGSFFNLRTKRSGARSNAFLVERSLKLDSSSVAYDFLPDRIFQHKSPHPDPGLSPENIRYIATLAPEPARAAPVRHTYCTARVSLVRPTALSTYNKQPHSRQLTDSASTIRACAHESRQFAHP